MPVILWICVVLFLTDRGTWAAAFQPAPQQFRQEIARQFTEKDGAPKAPVALVDCSRDGVVRVFTGENWYDFENDVWHENVALKSKNENSFCFADNKGNPVEVAAPWHEVRQILRAGRRNFIAAGNVCIDVNDGKELAQLRLPENLIIRQMAISPDGLLHVASSAGLWVLQGTEWRAIHIEDDGGRAWAVGDVLGVAFDSARQLWFASKAGVGCKTSKGWRFFEGKDGLPWNDFTGIAAGLDGEVWFATHLGVVRFDGKEWSYREGPRWLPNDDVRQVAVDPKGNAWFATAGGIGEIERRTMTLAEKAEYYERDIEYIKRTPYGYVSRAALTKPADKSTATTQDDDNDGLWTAMYGAGECFAYGATHDPKAKDRAKKAFEALRFLQKVTQGGTHSPPKGYIARSIRPASGPDPNAGVLENDRRDHDSDSQWKVLDPRWPLSADGQWYWKADTSSDELDGHFFFYPLYYDLCADTDAERERVREVVRDITNDLMTHGFNLIDHDGTPTRWGIFGPQYLNHDPRWWPERGLNSLSLLSYLAVAEHMTGEPKYAAASRELIEKEGYAHNAMYSKVQRGPGTGNQSDNEMAFMDYYDILHYSQDEELKKMMRTSFYLYWLNVAPEMNPFFNFAYAAHNLEATPLTLKSWPDWHEDSMATLLGFPLDWIEWPLRNSQRLDVVPLPSNGLDFTGNSRKRGNRINGKVIPVENRYFDHWNTDPWELDYGGNGTEFGAGTVFLLPYYMGLYHGFIQKPKT
ncbi:MAG TPA: hypothetical protein VGO67_11670 [Verrucomicrobiae bacterium]|jgi:hypothetical protein